MPRQIRLTFVQTGESVIAEMLDDEAPRVCQLVWERLPVEQQMIHAQYSGAEVYLLLERAEYAPPENLVRLPLPGEICYFCEPPGSVTGAQEPASEILIIYHRGVTLRG